MAKQSQNIFLKKVANVNQLNTMWTLSQHYYHREQVKNKGHHLNTRNYWSHQHQTYNQLRSNLQLNLLKETKQIVLQTDLSEINNWLLVILKLMDIYNELPDTSRSTIQDANFTINESGLINILILKEAIPNDIFQM